MNAGLLARRHKIIFDFDIARTEYRRFGSDTDAKRQSVGFMKVDTCLPQWLTNPICILLEICQSFIRISAVRKFRVLDGWKKVTMVGP